MSDPLNQIELISTLSVPHYAPRLKATIIPTARWNDEPLLCLKLNDEWVSHLLGVMTALDQPDTWIGTNEEIYDARQQVNEIMVAFMEDCNPMDNCCPEPNRTRFTSTGQYEISYDGGVTWVSGDDLDPRVTSPTLPPIAGDNGNLKRCDAANSVLVQIKDKVEAWEGMLSTAGTLVEFGTAAVALLAVLLFAPAAVPFLLGVCLTLLKTLWDAGAETYHAAFTDTVFNDLLCILYCHARSDGKYDEAAISAIISDCASQFDPIPRDAFSAAFKGWGAVGTTNAAAVGGGGEDCDDCECEGCDATWIVGNVDGYPAFGTLVDVDDTGYTFQSHLHTDGANYLSILTTDETKGCRVLSVTEVDGGGMPSTGVAAAHIVLPNTQHVGNIVGGTLLVDADLSYIAWNSSNAFKIKILFG